MTLALWIIALSMFTDVALKVISAVAVHRANKRWREQPPMLVVPSNQPDPMTAMLGEVQELMKAAKKRLTDDDKGDEPWKPE